MQFYQSTILNNFPDIKHAFTTRDSSNLAFHVNDNPLHVEQNHDALCTKLNYDKHSLIHMKQIHSDIVHIVNEDDNFDTPQTCDALITNKKNTPLMVMVADCSPILFYDDKVRVIAVAHAGRAGAFKNIVKNVIDTFTNEFKSDISNLHVSIGPNINACCYEVGSEIYNEAKELGLEYAIELKNNSYYLDINSIIKKQLLTSKVKEKNIEFSNECTTCNSSKYYSYRADSKCGRFAGIIELT
ncbi:peptidoglycan editing factor PgeF [Sulfurimonas sp.]|nr:peptidoglycan editing factor PgeF [Sulfurimonas sp.]